MNRFEGKFAIISGGASGMGALTAKKFVEEGGSAVTIDINESEGKKVASEIGDKCEFLKVDVTKQEDWDNLENYLGERFKKITTLHFFDSTTRLPTICPINRVAI